MYLLPKPQKTEYYEGTYTIHYQSGIIIATDCSNEVFQFAKILNMDMEEKLGFSLSIIKGIAEENGIYLENGPELAEQEYTLQITSDRIIIRGGDEAGILYGI
ncbi:MAG TPA: glycoside hydrolase family 20 zincin-like fold domain-containing protein [Mobilitalea sp.]|nr:glycoside hydrolase family 20 zincin-like fold domain-containing protein [Mobilitalea sp.]